MVLDIGNFDNSCTDYSKVIAVCTIGRQPPMVPETFTEVLQKKTFTEGPDIEFVAAKYGQVARKIFASVYTLQFDNLGWGNDDADKLASSLMLMPLLKHVALF